MTLTVRIEIVDFQRGEDTSGGGDCGRGSRRSTTISSLQSVQVLRNRTEQHQT